MSQSKKMPIEVMVNVISLLFITLGILQVSYMWIILGNDDAKNLLALPLIAVVVWGAFTFIEKSDENINLPMFLNEDKELNLKHNRLFVNLVKNMIVIGLIVVNWRDVLMIQK